MGRECEAVPVLQDERWVEAGPVVHWVRPEPEQGPKGEEDYKGRGRILQQWRFLRGGISQGQMQWERSLQLFCEWEV